MSHAPNFSYKSSLSTDTNPDLSIPLSTLLRTTSLHLHHQAESSLGARLLASGDPSKLTKENYAKYLARLWVVYRELEQALDEYAPTHLILSSMYNPSILSRTQAIEEDIRFYLDLPPSDPLHTHPAISSVLSFRASTSTWASLEDPAKRYIDRICKVSESHSNNGIGAGLLLAHAYVRYMGDLSGGQFIRKKIIKAFELNSFDDYIDGKDSHSSTDARGESIMNGVRFYDFRHMDRITDTIAGPGTNDSEHENSNVKRIKDWFREAVDDGFARFVEENGLDKDEADGLKLALINETNLAFELSMGLFDLIRSSESASIDSKGPISEFEHKPTNLQTLHKNPDLKYASDSESIISSTVILFFAAVALTVALVRWPGVWTRILTSMPVT